jgi:hypothetical protein
VAGYGECQSGLLQRDTAFTDLEGGNMPSIDLTALRLVKVPDAAPPYDCDAHGVHCPALDDRDAFGGAVDVEAMWEPASDVAWDAVPRQPAGASAGGAAGTTTAWPRQFAHVMVEILAGVRPVRQVVPWATERALAQIRHLAPAFASDRRPRLQRVVTSQPAARVVEMTVIAGFGPRTRAVAIRFEHVAARPAAPGLPPRPARWLCTDVEAG